MYRCRNDLHGCTFETHSFPAFATHERHCKLVSREAYDRIQKAYMARSHVCLVCGGPFTTRKALNDHEVRVHTTMVPRQCPDCQSNETFTTRWSWQKHRDQTHRNWHPSQCPVSGCKDRPFFTSSHSLAGHVRVYHFHLSKEQRRQVLATIRAIHKSMPEGSKLSWEDMDPMFKSEVVSTSGHVAPPA